ncbi:DNA-directed RNA polymerases I and III subunit RPAC1-like [Oratosquilla oratoria]|uniref:DNA-directed RNA polymerases I and III subunit RPAC1-like n=1 Tax=Oratosquilla oratoria TaxID=337810 RepID=UPI003F762878
MDCTRIKLEEFQVTEDPVTLVDSTKKNGLQGATVQIINMDDVNMEIDFVGFHISLVNALRRLILAEVATMAIEKVYMYNNTSIVQDEVLAHRLGLVPLKVDPRYFEFRNKDETEWGAQDSVQYTLKVKCSKNPKASSTETDPDLMYLNRKITSSSLEWKPIGNQPDIFRAEAMQPLHDDILLAKLNPGHEIYLEAYAVKGIGSDHAKFQPGLSWYRLLPEIELAREVEGTAAELLQRCFSPGVIDIVTNKEGKRVARVANARGDSCSRNVFHYDEIKDAVKLSKNTDHVIFYVESHCSLKSSEILEEAVSLLISKCDNILAILDKET